MENLLEKLEKIGAIKKGDFLLKGGGQSSVYFDIKRAYGDPELFNELIEAVSLLVPKEVTCIAGSGNGGIPLATGVALKLHKKLSIVRDIPKGHGTKKVIDGYEPKEADRVVVVDDVLTSGTSLRQTIENLKDTTILRCIVILKRGEAVGIVHKIFYLATSDDVGTTQ